MSADPSCLVRPALPEEAPTLIDFQLRLARESEGLELAPEVLASGVHAVFADPAKGRYWVALTAGNAGRIAGGLLTTYEWSDWRNGTILWVQSVYVLPEERGRGVYRSLYEILKRTVEGSPELAGIRLYVDRRNEAAQRTYERLGMTREHYHLYEWLKA
ncbi:MAG TPA: GNAT family N-acetyltransferase [Thermoanaerobaculia bacterium]|nr:GNAT family N-acetyltransferase [Thermoanaerobaculia bacterium]